MSHRRGLRSLRGILPQCDELEDLNGAGVDDEMDALFEEQMADAFAEADEDEALDGMVTTTTKQQSASSMALREAVATQSQLEQQQRELGFTLPVRFDVVDATPVPADAWLYDETQAEYEFSEDALVHRHLRTHIDRRPLAANPPPMGCGRVREVPNHVSTVLFPPWSLLWTPPVTVANTVVTFNVNHPLNLTEFAHRVVSVGYNPRRFAAASMRLSNNRTALFFSRGSVVCTGAKGELLSVSACLEFVTTLQRLLMRPTEMRAYRMQNVVSNGAAGFPINLKLLAARYPMNAEYASTRFPGLVFRLNCRQRVFIIFGSGQCIITGFKSRFESCLAWRWLFLILWEFKLANGDEGDTDAEAKRKMAEDARVAAATTRRIARIYSDELVRQSENADVGDEFDVDDLARKLLSADTHNEQDVDTWDLVAEQDVVSSWFAQE
jgi:transcription initiation factor TFIID TATA-box-binding protein